MFMRVIALLLLAAGFQLFMSPALVADSVTIHDLELVRLPSGVRLGQVTLPPEDRNLPIVSPSAKGNAFDLLRRLDAEQRAQGFAGILYDNRDRGHSALPSRLFPRLTRLAYSFELVSDGLDYGLAGGLLLSPVVFGNSSTAITNGPAPRSLPRYAMTSPGGPRAQTSLYVGNDLYVYPEHRDYDDVDRYPANWPYMLISQGSSGSDQPFLEAIALTLAAFPPETFALMQEKGLVAPTLQMIFRRSLAPVTAPDDYLSGVAHPVVFDATLLRPDLMVATAAAMRPEDVPPLVLLSVEKEGFSAAAGLAGLNEKLFDTPSAIARIWRAPSWEKEMILVAAATHHGERPLTFAWRLLQGLEDRVKIVPLDPEGRRARVRVNWHDAFAIGDPAKMRQTSRVDIGVFASNGQVISAPAILSISFPTHEQRSYGPLENGEIGLLSVDYDAIHRWAYYDPLLHWSAPWTDAPLRDDAGAITGWTRTAREGRIRTISSLQAYRMDKDRPDQPLLVEELRRIPW
jgi:hypothetical protein